MTSQAGNAPTTTLSVAMKYPARGFNEAYRNYTGGGGYFVANNIFSRLVNIDIYGSGAIHPDLAERWEVLDGGRTYRFFLRDARWHDGHPVCAEDVRETYLTAIREGYRAAASLGDVQDVVVRGDRVVDIELVRPNSGFLAQLAIFVWTHILPAHLYAGTDWTTNPANDAPIGTGPYRFDEWSADGRIRIVANPDYFGTPPAVDAIEFHVVPDVAEAIGQLTSGEIDFCTQDIPCTRYHEVAAAEGVRLTGSRGNALGNLTFNVARTPWDDVRVRRAIAMLIDREALAAEVCSRAVPAPYAYLEHVDWAFNPSARFPAFDPHRAVELLDEAGLHPDQQGVRLRGTIVCRDLFPYWQAATRALARTVAEVGIELDVVSLSAEAWSDRIQDCRDFDLLVDGLGIGPDPVLFEEVLLSDSVLNVGSYRNAELDELFRQGKAAQTREGRAEAYRAAQLLIASDLPRIHLLLHGHHLGYRDRWQGWSWDPAVGGRLPAWSLESVRPAASPTSA
jgi:peptide/nickel transport system substrate-binding protein